MADAPKTKADGTLHLAPMPEVIIPDVIPDMAATREVIPDLESDDDDQEANGAPAVDGDAAAPVTAENNAAVIIPLRRRMFIKLYRATVAAPKVLWHGFLETFRFSNMWLNSFPGFLMGYLQFFRNFLTTPLFGYTIMPEEPKDAFWVINQAVEWVRKVPAFDWVISNVIYGFQKVTEWLSQAFKWAAPALPYIPVVGLGVSALISTYDFVKSENKNVVSTFKFIADVAGAVLLGVGLGLMTWGGAALALYTAPYLIVAAAAVVGVVGLVKTGFHLYKAYDEPEHRKEHLRQAAKAFFVTIINVTASVLTLLGAQMGKDVANGFATGDWSLFGNAAQTYQGAAVATNVVLGAGAALGVMTIVPAIYSGCKKLVAKLRGTIVEEPVVNVNRVKLEEDLRKQIEKLNGEIFEHSVGDNANSFLKSRDTARYQKREVLSEALHVLNGTAGHTHETLLKTESDAKKLCSYKHGLYQGTFFSLESKTKTLVDKVKELAPAPAKAPRAGA